MLMAHISNRKRQTESKTARIRKMIESVNASFLADKQPDSTALHQLTENINSLDLVPTTQVCVFRHGFYLVVCIEEYFIPICIHFMF